MTELQSKLPHWDMSVVYPGLDSPEFQEGFELAVESVADLEQLFDQHEIGRQDSVPIDEASIEVFEQAVERLNDLLDTIGTLFSYTYAFVATDSKDELAQARLSELQQKTLKLSLLGTRFAAWIGSLDAEQLIQRSAVASEHAFAVRKAKIEAEHQMEPELEELAEELRLTGSTAWTKLHGTYSSQLTVPIELHGKAQSLPMSEVRNLAYDADRDVRRTAYEAELTAWGSAEVALAAALNSIKGEVGRLSERRNWASPLDAALFGNNIDQESLEAMMEAARESFSDFRRYLRTKARLLGLEELPWFDLFAPVGASTGEWPYDKAASFIIEQFGTYSDRLAGLAERAFKENWIDAEPRDGKRDGAFCIRLRGEESRVLSNFKPVYSQMHTLAHELGHAYHNLNLAQRTMLQRETPMVLAETASMFCQTIIQQSILKEVKPHEQIAILEEGLQDACQVVLDITSRFQFESRVFGQRTERELSPEEFKELMLQAQRDTYRDGLDPEFLHPYMWAVKPHYYSGARSFYNYPYMFGLLFGLGLYAQYEQDPDGFRSGYDDLLSSTGMRDAAELASQFGIDIRTPEFWSTSLDIVRVDIDRFETLVEQELQQPT